MASQLKPTSSPLNEHTPGVPCVVLQLSGLEQSVSEEHEQPKMRVKNFIIFVFGNYLAFLMFWFDMYFHQPGEL